jgi:hypothetical protein
MLGLGVGLGMTVGPRYLALNFSRPGLKPNLDRKIPRYSHIKFKYWISSLCSFVLSVSNISVVMKEEHARTACLWPPSSS